MTRATFRDRHWCGNWCKVSKAVKDDKLPLLKFGKLDVPDAVDNRTYCTAIEDQGSLPWCAAYTAAAFAENVLWRRDGKIKQIEVEPIYKWAKLHDGDAESDGTTLDAVLDCLCSTGVFDGNTCKIRKVGRGWTGTDIEDVKATVHRFGCFLAGFNMTDEWYELANNARRTISDILPRQQLGGHAVLVCGYTPEGVWIENSWGKSWGSNGFGFLTWKAFSHQYMYGTVLTHCLDGFK